MIKKSPKIILIGAFLLALSVSAQARDFMVVGPQGITVGQYNRSTGELFAIGPDSTVLRQPNSTTTFDWGNNRNVGQSETMKQSLGEIEMERNQGDVLDGDE